MYGIRPRNLNLKNMKEVLVNYSGDAEEMDKIWGWFHGMACCGFITQETWKKFYDCCAGWYVTEDRAEVRDSHKDDTIVWRYTGDAEYKA